MGDQSTTNEYATEPARRVSDEQVSRDLAHAYLWQMTAEDTFLMSAGYPGDLRDARAAIAAERERAEKAERERDALRDLKPGIARQRRQIMRLRHGDDAKAIKALCSKASQASQRARDAEARLYVAECELVDLRDREQRDGQVTEALVEAALSTALGKVMWLWQKENYPAIVRLRRSEMHLALEAALAARPTGQPSDSAEAFDAGEAREVAAALDDHGVPREGIAPYNLVGRVMKWGEMCAEAKIAEALAEEAIEAGAQAIRDFLKPDAACLKGITPSDARMISRVCLEGAAAIRASRDEGSERGILAPAPIP